MPEIKEEHKNQFVGPEEKIDFNSIPYKDKQKEASRLQKLEEYKTTGVWPSKKKKKMVRILFSIFDWPLFERLTKLISPSRAWGSPQ